jgi:hypothetical protein
MMSKFAFLALPGLLLTGLSDEGGAFSSDSAPVVSVAGERPSVMVDVQDKSHLLHWLQIHRAGGGAPVPSVIVATDTRPKWNFHKYLIDRSGTRVESFSTLTSPESRSLIAAIEKRLAENP